EVAYYLVHAMAGGPGFGEREQAGARNFARMAREEGVARIVYLGGLGEHAVSEHLRSRHETALTLAAEGPPLTYFRAAMIVGSRSESYRTLRYLVKRLPVMIAPRWLQTATQPIGIDDVVAYLTRAPEVPASAGREIQIGGPDVLSYGEMLDRMAIAMGSRPRPKLPVPLITPALSALWLGLVTPVDTNVARPLVEGLTTATVVTDPSGARLFDVAPMDFDHTLRVALAEETGAAGAAATRPSAS
ncbi:MAG TPA: epimerase, partial [Solirubrobacteraceae bacterium]|nr:epimerase [Solirubrobacteraceae bacterium]